MPMYKVTAPGFYQKLLYDPRGKRKTLTTEKPLKPVPSWLEPMKASDTAKSKKSVGTLDKKEKLSKEEIEAEVAHVTFMGEGGHAPVVETL